MSVSNDMTHFLHKTTLAMALFLAKDFKTFSQWYSEGKSRIITIFGRPGPTCKHTHIDSP